MQECVCVRLCVLASVYLFSLEIFSLLTLVLGYADDVKTMVVESEDALLWFEHVFNVSVWAG